MASEIVDILHCAINATPILIFLVKGSWGELMAAIFHVEVVQKDSNLDDEHSC